MSDQPDQRRMKRIFLRRLVFAALRYSGIPLLCRELLQRNRVTILCYHDPSPEVANTHFAILCRYYNVISLREYVDWREGRGTRHMPRKALIITMDDGHHNNFLLRDVLQRHAVPLTIFVCSSIVGTRRHYWWKTVNYRSYAEMLKRIPDKERLEHLKAFGFAEATEFAERQALSKAELRELSTLVDIQSHTRFHPILPQCTDERAWQEIAGSRQELIGDYGAEVFSIAYPNGDHSERDVRFAQQAGYQCGLTTIAGYNDKSTDMFRLRRLGVDDSADANELVVKASGLWGWLERFGKGNW